MPPPKHMLPVAARPPPSLWQRVRAVLFFFIFILGCCMVNGAQFAFLLPLRIACNRAYKDGVRYTKGGFGCLLVLMCQWFAPSAIRVTFEREGMGGFDDPETVVRRDAQGDVEYLDLPERFVLIGNHQVYLDWWYMWCLTYFIGPRGVHKYVYITLKKSLKWLPVVGWGMQFFSFIFLARSWASDRAQLAASLSRLGMEAEEEDNPLAFILYPEGTLVSPQTRPISKKFADKLGISDLSHSLLPRSTGLLYSLRSLAPRIPSLKLLDVTIAYPGIPSMGYGQDYYTMRSVFLDGVFPPMINMHIRMFDVATEVPIGDLSSTKAHVVPPSNGPDEGKTTVEVDIPEKEKEVFDAWLRLLWTEKDNSIDAYHRSGTVGLGSPPVDLQLRLKRRREYLDAFCFLLPAGVGYLLGKARA
ncbi:acyltransferase-domain-containing protein [Schizophyllum amplum]|uniref:Acyltransferase-domain-containing protein n=1 Tax=Schizophyllum amplum TaxID=97359 RepID=A0A550C9W4_9AGAR|nr:acyltransferase-domain-containing protein [Auriculariopsis ampla]